MDPPTGSPRAGIFNILTIREEATRAKLPNYDLIPDDLKPHLNEHQQLGVAKAVEAMHKNEGFLMADGTSVEKTRQLLVVAARFARQCDPVLIVAPAADVMRAEKRKGSGPATRVPALGGGSDSLSLCGGRRSRIERVDRPS